MTGSVKNPVDVLGKFPQFAALFDLKNPAIPTQKEIAYASAPFDWSAGYDIEAILATMLGQPGFKLPVNNQGASGSCGGQADEKLGEVLNAVAKKSFTRMSAKFTYAPIAYPGGGTTDGDLVRISTRDGWAPEVDTPSYQNAAGAPEVGGFAPSEAFMEQEDDITIVARQDAIVEQAMSPIYIGTDIESIAQGIRDYYGVRIGIVGSNNGTWISAEPTPPTPTEDIWSHFLYAGKARTDPASGVKQIGILNSWGAEGVGDPAMPGWQWLDASYFGVPLPQSVFQTSIWAATSYLFNASPATELHYSFPNSITFGETGEDVIALQKALQIDGEFPLGVPCTGYYGAITARAVLAFQRKYALDTPQNLVELNGMACHAKTAAKLNALFNQ